jgi:PAS domain S-box-containing protein
MKPAAADVSATDFLEVPGEMARRIREFDWEGHPLGSPEQWPQSLKTAIRIMLGSRFAMWMGWGREFFFFCNDAYMPTLGNKRGRALGTPATEVWAEIWKDIGPRAESVVEAGRATWDECLQLFLERSGYTEETYHTFSYSPLPDDTGGIGGMLCVVTEETDRVIAERRMAFLRDLGSDIASIYSEDELFRAVQKRLAAAPKDIPFALLYLVAPDDEEELRLAFTHTALPGPPLAPETLRLDDGAAAWPAAPLFEIGRPITVEGLAARFADLPCGPWDHPPRQAVLVPVGDQAREKPAGFVVAGLNPYRPMSQSYGDFLELFAGQMAAGLATARAYEAERKRAEALAEINRAKTAFFSNVSHEFRTPLTLLLGPLEEILARRGDGLAPGDGELVAVAHRNGLRLHKLVNALLDYSRLEAGRQRAWFEPTDLGTYTAELASLFRSAIDKAGLELIVDCLPLTEPVPVDREMWEKIVLNLVSNAFKFTLRGSVAVTVRPIENAVEMIVRDTGIGIPEEARPHLFERFYRVEGAQGRTHEGSGIGLALVQELVKLHGGTVRAESEVGVGSAFIVTLPRSAAQPTAESRSLKPARNGSSHPPTRAEAFIAEALRWLPWQKSPAVIEEDEDAAESPNIFDSHGRGNGVLHEGAAAAHRPAENGNVDIGSPPDRPSILIADDNADMRDYLARLLSPRYEIVAVADGEAALERARRERPDLVLTDAMMPRLDGFALLHELRNDPALQGVPIILLSARAGEEARVEGLDAGADDYITKPFHARELLARVNGTLNLARVRSEALAREKELQTERAGILQKVRDSAQQLHLIADTAPVHLAHCDAEHRFKFVNKPYAALHAVRPEEVIGQRMEDVLGRDAYDDIRLYIERVLRGEPVNFEVTQTIRKAGPRHFRCAYAPERNADGAVCGFVAAIVDITDRKAAELRLAEQARLLDLSFDAIFVRDVHGRITYWSKGAEISYGYTFAEALGRNAKELLRTVFPKPVEEILAELHRNGRWIGELRHTRKDGSQLIDNTRWVLDRDAQGHTSSILETNTDITERKQTESLLVRQQRLLEMIATGCALDDCLAALCLAVSELNPRTRACVLLADAARRKFIRAVAPDLAPEFTEGIKGAPIGEDAIGTCGAAVFSGQTVTCTDIALSARWDPAWRELCLGHGIRACSSAPVLDADGLAFASVVLCLDEPREPNEWEQRLIAFGTHVARVALERERASRALREAKETAEAANRSKDRFLAVLSHELRTPLTPVLMAVAALEEDVTFDAEVREDFAMMKRNIELETKLIDDLLDLSRVTSGKLSLHIEPVNLDQLVHHVCEICEIQLAEQRVHLEIDLQAGDGMVAADAARLQQVLWNVLKNAIKFTSSQGTVRVSTRRLAEERFAVQVRDQGIGIPADLLPRIFDAFEQGDSRITRQFGGLGLGLAISKALVDLHRGTIRAESPGAGQGATFTIELPAAAGASDRPVAVTAPEEPGKKAGLRLLLVEDNQDTARTLGRLLRHAGFAVTTASNIAGARAAAESEAFDLLVSDLGLPDGTGYDVMRAIRKKCDCPGIAMSGYGMEEDQRRSREAGFSEHLVKPIDVPQLLAAILRVTKGRQTSAEQGGGASEP